jgi:hypothetical protein
MAEVVIDGSPMQIEGNRDLARRIAMKLAMSMAEQGEH